MLAQFESTKDVNYPTNYSRQATGKIRLNIEEVVFRGDFIAIRGNWSTVNDGKIFPFVKENYPYAEINQLEDGLPQLTETQRSTAVITERIPQMVYGLLNWEHSVDADANWGLTSNDIEML